MGGKFVGGKNRTTGSIFIRQLRLYTHNNSGQHSRVTPSNLLGMEHVLFKAKKTSQRWKEMQRSLIQNVFDVFPLNFFAAALHVCRTSALKAHFPSFSIPVLHLFEGCITVRLLKTHTLHLNRTLTSLSYTMTRTQTISDWECSVAYIQAKHLADYY